MTRLTVNVPGDLPSGSTAVTGVALPGAGSLWKYHQGMPFCMVTMLVLGIQQVVAGRRRQQPPGAPSCPG
jgi:hypothetical protein